ncbi:hypothetical protein ACLBXO_22415 [Methylobacterium sp. C33D]
MKQIDLTGVVLNPAAGTLDFSCVNIDPRTVLAVLHEPTNQFIYAVGRRGLGRKSINGQVLTLAFNTKFLSAGPITGFRDDGADVATDARLEACRALLATGNATLSNVATGIGTPSDTAPGSDAGAGSLIAKVTRLLLTQSGIATVLAAIRDRLPATLVGGRLSVDGSGVTQPISAAALPLPAGAATAAKQDAAATTLASILAAFAPLAADASVQAGTAKAEAIRALLAGTLKVATPTPASIVTGQVKIAATGTAVALPNVALVNGIVVKAKTSNAAQTAAAPGVVGPAGVTTVIDGTGSGYPLAPGEAASFACSNANLVSVNGTAGDVFFYEGN